MKVTRQVWKSWIKPLLRMLKINTDASIKSAAGLVGLGDVITRDSTDVVIAAWTLVIALIHGRQIT